MKRLSLFLLVVMLFVSGCSSSTTTNDSQEENILKIDLVAEPVSTDPQQVTDINSMRILQNMYDRLVGWDDEGFNMIPKLAESWNESEDGLEYTFYLREGVTFHDGTPVNADAIKFTFDRMLDENHPYFETGPFPFAQFYYGQIDSVNVIDEYTVVFNLKARYAPFLKNLTAVTASIVSPSAVKQYEKDFSINGVGSGPFALKSWNRGTELTLEANENYWDGRALLDQVIYHPIAEDLVRVTRLNTGQTDLIVDVDPDSIAGLESDINFNVIQQIGPHVWWVGLNTNKAPFDNVKVRQAVNFAVDNEAIVNDILKGTGVVSNQPLAPVLPGHNDNLESYAYNPQKAKELLEEAGYPDGFTINFLVPASGSGMQSPIPMATAVQGYLDEVGITVSINRMEWGTFLGEINQGARDVHDMWALSWMTGTGDSDLPLYNLLHTETHPPGFNSGYYSNPKVDELIKKAQSTTNEEERVKLYKEASKYINEDAPWIFIDHAKQTAAHANHVKNFNLHPSHVFDLYKVSIEK
jgi:peptide/nickel transport system substrate-binding protein